MNGIRNTRLRNTRLRNEYLRLQSLQSRSPFFIVVQAVGSPPEAYLLRFDIKSLVKENGRIVGYEGPHHVELYVPNDYPLAGPKILIRSPGNLFHPNVAMDLGIVCLNKFIPSMWLDTTCIRIAELISYKTFTMAERESLNHESCMYARNHRDLFPTDERPFLKPTNIKVY